MKISRPLLIVIALIVVLVSAYWITKGNLLNEVLKPSLERLLSDSLGTKITIEKIDIALYKASLKIKNMRSEDGSFTIPKLKASIQLRELLLGRLTLNKVYIQNPKIALDPQKKRQKKYAKKFRFKISTPRLFYLKFKDILIEHADLSIKTSEFMLGAPDVSLHIQSLRKNRFSINLKTENGYSKIGQTAFKIGEAELEGTIDNNLSFGGHLLFKRVTIKEKYFDSVAFDFSWDKDTLSISDFALPSAIGPMLMKADFTFDRAFELDSAQIILNDTPFYFQRIGDKTSKRLQITAPSIALNKFFGAGWDASGQGFIKGELLFGVPTPLLELNAQLKDVSIKKIYLGTVEGSLSFNFSELKTTFNFKHPKNKGQGTLSTSLSVKSNHIVGSGHLTAKKFFIMKEFFSYLDIPFTLSKQGLWVESGFIQKKQGRIILAGSIDLKQKMNISVSSLGLSLEEFNTFSNALQGSLSLAGDIYGSLKDPSFELTLKVKDTYLGKKYAGSSLIKARLEKSQLTSEMILFGEQIKQKSTINFKKNMPFEIEAIFNEFNFLPFLFLFRSSPPDLNSRLTGTTKIKGFFNSHWISTASINLSELLIFGSRLDVQNTSPIILSVKKNVYELTPFEFQGTHTSISFSGSKKRQGELAFVAEGIVNNRLIGLFLPFIARSDGQARVSLRVAGNVDQVQIFGNYVTSGSVVKLSHFPHRFENLYANVSFSKNKISIHKLSSVMGGGDFGLTGDIVLKPGAPAQIDLLVSLSNNRIQFPSWLISQSSGNISIQGDKKPYLLKGNLFISEALYADNVDFRSKLLSLKRRPYLPKIRDVEQPLFSLDVTLRAPKRVFVKNNLANLESSADLILKGTSDRISLLGKIELLSGTAIFKGRPFDLKAASVIFDNPIEVNPTFHFESETEIQDYKVTVGADGTVTNYRLFFSSVPELPESDIISLITFGATREDIEKRGVFDVTSLELGSLFFGDVQKAVKSVAKQSLGVDFNLNPSYSDTKLTTVPRLIVGKRLTKKIDVTFSSTLDRSTIFTEKELNLKYNIHRNLSILGFLEDPSDEKLQDNENFGIDFKVQFEFR